MRGSQREHQTVTPTQTHTHTSHTHQSKWQKRPHTAGATGARHHSWRRWRAQLRQLCTQSPLWHPRTRGSLQCPRCRAAHSQQHASARHVASQACGSNTSHGHGPTTDSDAGVRVHGADDEQQSATHDASERLAHLERVQAAIVRRRQVGDEACGTATESSAEGTHGPAHSLALARHLVPQSERERELRTQRYRAPAARDSNGTRYGRTVRA
jgi:hypothetical protein